MNFSDEYPLLKGRHIFKSITFENMIRMIYKFKTGVILIGGSWCKNCQAVIGIINETAKENKIRTVYCYDPRFINIFKEEEDLRDCKSLETKLNYYELVEKIGFKSDEYVVDTLIPRIKVPAVIGLRNGICVGIIESEYINDKIGLHEESSAVDMTSEYKNSLTSLFKKVKAKE